MDTPIAKILGIALGLVVTVLTISAAMRMASTGVGVTSRFQDEEDQRARLEEYAALAMYDDAEVSGADIISCIYRYAGLEYDKDDYEIWVEGYNNTVMPSPQELELLVDVFEIPGPYHDLVYKVPTGGLPALEAKIEPTRIYNSSLSYTANNNVKAIMFTIP